MEDKSLKRSCVDFLPADEEHFWKELIVKYLKPLDATKEETVIDIQPEKFDFW
jgi:hypothetical protein